MLGTALHNGGIRDTGETASQGETLKHGIVADKLTHNQDQRYSGSLQKICGPITMPKSIGRKFYDPILYSLENLCMQSSALVREAGLRAEQVARSMARVNTVINHHTQSRSHLRAIKCIFLH